MQVLILLKYERPRINIQGLQILFSKITVPGIGQLSNFLIDDLVDFTAWYLTHWDEQLIGIDSWAHIYYLCHEWKIWRA